MAILSGSTFNLSTFVFYLKSPEKFFSRKIIDGSF